MTGWINELSSAPGRLRLHAPVVGSEEAPIAGPVRYEISTGRATDSIAIAGLGHLAYPPTEAGLAAATLTRRLYQSEPREPIERSQFGLLVSEREDSSQVDVALALDGGFEPGYLYELIYEAQDPVLAGAGMSAIRDAVAAIRRDQKSDLLQDLNLPKIRYTIAYGVSQSGRLLRQFVYDGFNADLNGNRGLTVSSRSSPVEVSACLTCGLPCQHGPMAIIPIISIPMICFLLLTGTVQTPYGEAGRGARQSPSGGR